MLIKLNVDMEITFRNQVIPKFAEKRVPTFKFEVVNRVAQANNINSKSPQSKTQWVLKISRQNYDN